MSWMDDELDKLFQDASRKSKQPVFQDHFFDEIVHLLPQQKKKKITWWYFSPLLLTFLFFPLTHHETKIESESYIKSNVTSKKLKSDSEKNDASNFGTKNMLSENKTNISASSLKEQNYSSFELVSQPKIDHFNNLTDNVDIPESIEVSGTENLGKNEEVNNEFKLLKLNLSAFQPFKNEGSIQALKLKLQNNNKQIFFGGSVGMIESFIKSSTSKPSPMIDLIVGYRKKFKNVNADIGLNVSCILPQKMIFQKESRVYGVRINDYKQETQFKSIFILELPLSLSKQVNKHSFGLTIAPQFNLGSYLSVRQTNNELEISNKNYFGNRFALTNFGLKTSLGYNYQLPNQIEIGVQLANYWNSPFLQAKINNELNKNPIIGQISIKKYIRIK